MKPRNVENLNSFACFILCHGRPDNTPTYKTLKKCGYTGKIYIICDDEDTTLTGYQENFGKENVQIFNKTKSMELFDVMDNFNNRKCAVYARNACFEIARNLNLQYFCELDDDYTDFRWRYIEDNQLKSARVIELDEVFLKLLNFMNTSEDFYSVAMAQGGDYIGGVGSRYKYRLYRKCMNSWICDVDKPFTFNGTMNDDVNAYTLWGTRGKLFLTVMDLCIIQPETQRVAGGMTELYKGAGTYRKSFYTTLQCPSFAKIQIMGDRYYRPHHFIDQEHAYPKVISSIYKKEEK